MRWLIAFLCLAGAANAADAPGLYAEHCAECHGPERLGAMGPALLPGNLGRLKRDAAAGVIRDGRVSTQMPGFAELLDDAAVEALADLIFKPPIDTPVWAEAHVVASRIEHVAPTVPNGPPLYDADPLNLFVVVESGDHHVSLLDGDSFEVITRFPSRYALHGGAKFSPDGRFVYFGSRDGWVSKYDLHRLELVAEVRAGINTRNIAISADGRVVAVANYLPKTLVMLDADLRLLRMIPATTAVGRTTSRVSAVYQAAPRESFVVALKDIPEMWEISYAEVPPPVLADFVESHENGRADALVANDDAFPIRRVPLTAPLDDFFFDPTYRLVMGSARGAGKAVVVHLDVRREIAEIAMPGLPHLGSGISWMRNGARVMATPHLGKGRISVINMDDWSEIATIDTLGPGFFMRSHEDTPYAWADVFFGPNKDAIHVIDKQSLEIVRTLRPEPGKTAAHIEFTRDGSHALVSLWEHDGAIIVYDATSLEEVTRIPFVKPSGKYNVYNKISLSEGTSH